MKERLCALLGLRTRKQCQCPALIRQLLAHLDQFRSSPFPEAQTLGRSLADWQEEIVRMWRFSRNNGITEGFHRKMKLIQRRAYGIKKNRLLVPNLCIGDPAYRGWRVKRLQPRHAKSHT